MRLSRKDGNNLKGLLFMKTYNMLLYMQLHPHTPCNTSTAKSIELGVLGPCNLSGTNSSKNTRMPLFQSEKTCILLIKKFIWMRSLWNQNPIAKIYWLLAPIPISKLFILPTLFYHSKNLIILIVKLLMTPNRQAKEMQTSILQEINQTIIWYKKNQYQSNFLYPRIIKWAWCMS